MKINEIVPMLSNGQCVSIAKFLNPDVNWQMCPGYSFKEWGVHDLVSDEKNEEGGYLHYIQIGLKKVCYFDEDLNEWEYPQDLVIQAFEKIKPSI